jgi:hypothetical protein
MVLIKQDFQPTAEQMVRLMEGMKGSSSVRQLIIRVSGQLAAGEIKLIEVTPEESTAAKARLDEVRKKRRETCQNKR